MKPSSAMVRKFFMQSGMLKWSLCIDWPDKKQEWKKTIAEEEVLSITMRENFSSELVWTWTLPNHFVHQASPCVIKSLQYIQHLFMSLVHIVNDVTDISRGRDTVSVSQWSNSFCKIKWVPQERQGGYLSPSPNRLNLSRRSILISLGC